MSGPARRGTPAGYEIRVEGHLDEHWAAWFHPMVLSRDDDGTTVLRGTVADQSALHGLLARVRDIGAALVSVEATDRARPAGRAGTAPGRHSHP